MPIANVFRYRLGKAFSFDANLGGDGSPAARQRTFAQPSLNGGSGVFEFVEDGFDQGVVVDHLSASVRAARIASWALLKVEDTVPVRMPRICAIRA